MSTMSEQMRKIVAQLRNEPHVVIGPKESEGTQADAGGSSRQTPALPRRLRLKKALEMLGAPNTEEESTDG